MPKAIDVKQRRVRLMLLGLLPILLVGWLVWRVSSQPIAVGLLTLMSPGTAIDAIDASENAGELFLEEHPDSRIRVLNAYEGSEPDQTVPAIEAALARGTRFFISLHPSKHAVASLHLFADGRALMLNVASTTPALTGRDDFLLRLAPDAVQEQQALARFVAQLPGRRLLVLRDTGNPPYTEPAFATFSAALGAQSRWEIVHQALPVQDFRPDDWQAVMAEPFDALYILAGTFQNAIGNIAQLFHVHHPEAPILLTPWTRSPAILDTAGEAIERIVLPSLYPARQADPRIDDYLTQFTRRFGYTPGMLTLGVRQSLELLDQAFDAGRTTPAAVRRYLLEHSPHPTSFGPVAFDANGDVPGAYPFQFIRDPRAEFQ